MKKIISVFLALILTFCLLIPAANASDKDEIYPTIIVAGYSSPDLYLKEGDSLKQVWGVNMDDILSAVLHNIAKIGIGLGGLAFGNAKYISNVVGSEMLNLYGVLAYNPDGTSVNDIVTHSKEAKDCQFSHLEKYENGEHMHEPEIMASVAEEYEKLGLNGNDWIFSFQHDFRQNIIASADDLDKFIDSVREFTGKDKVNLFAVSHGGEICAVYLSQYGKEKCAVHNAVLTVPAIGGAALAYDVMSENIVFDEETLLYFIENGMMLEEDYDWLVRANQFGILDDICNCLMHDHVKKLLGYWGSIWDFIPCDYYEEMKNTWLDPVQSAALIEKSDVYHNEIMPKMTESLNECLDAGINVSIVAGSDNPSVTGLQEQSDAIIRVKDSTGAYCAPYGQRFSDGYVTKKTVCTDESHNHLSPAMTVDASCAFLPENTWFINGLFHGMTWKDDYSVALCLKLLFAKERIDIYTYEEFPQFKYSTNRCYSAAASFDSSAEGYWNPEDTKLIVKNLSHEYKMNLSSVYCAGADINFKTHGEIWLDPQESAEISFSGSLPEESLRTADITLNYMLLGSITPYGCRTITFTICSGEEAVYDDNVPFVNAKQITAFDKSINGLTAKLLEKTGLFDWLRMIFNSLAAILAAFPKC